MKFRTLFVLLLVLAFVLCGCRTVATVETVPTTEPATEPTTEPTTVPTTEPEPQDEHFTLTFVGDCTLASMPHHANLESGFIKTIGEDYDYPFQNVRQYFENDDFTMVNFEGVLGEEGWGSQKMFIFRGPAAYTNILTGSSVEAVTLANNHSLDYGQAGYAETLRLLDEAEVTYVERNKTALYTTESGLTIGLCAAHFTIEFDDLEAQIAELKEQGAELIVFAIHWGNEGAYRPLNHQVDQAYKLIDMGVDIVYGHHPHVLQKIEEYNGGIIMYSLGNFCFGGNHNPPDMDSVIVQQEIIRSPEGEISFGERTLTPVSISSVEDHNNFQPTPYADGSEGYDRSVSKLDGSWTGPNLNVGY